MQNKRTTTSARKYKIEDGIRNRILCTCGMMCDVGTVYSVVLASWGAETHST